MKNNLGIPLIVLVVALLVCTTVKMCYDMAKKEPVVVQRAVRYPKFIDRRRSPEYRPPPYKEYKPSTFQQMGILTKGDGEILPLYGKESDQYRNRWNYYTSTPGNQIYPLPIQHNNRDCTEDIGCDEFYGSEDVTVSGKGEGYTTEIYRNKFA